VGKASKRRSAPQPEWWCVLVVGARCNPTNRWLAADAAVTRPEAVGFDPPQVAGAGSQPARVALWSSIRSARAEIRAGDLAYGRADGAEVVRKWKGTVEQPQGGVNRG